MTPIKNEFSRKLTVDQSIVGKENTITATEDELDSLAKRFEVNKIYNIEATYIITEKVDIHGAYILSMLLTSKVSKFVAGGKSEDIDINEKFDVVLLDEDMARNNHEQLHNCDIELFENGNVVDIGEIAAQYIALCIFM